MSNDLQRDSTHNLNIEDNKGDGKSRQSTCNFPLRRRRRKRRYLVVPETERDLCELRDAYCVNDDIERKQMLEETDGARDKKTAFTVDTSASSSQRRRCRSLPSTQLLSFIRNETTRIQNTTDENKRPALTKKSLLLRKFYESVGMKDDPSATLNSVPLEEKESACSNKKRAREEIDEIEDPSLSTLRIGHHRRYLQLTTNSKHQKTTKLTSAQRKELGKLRELISKEQASYRLALEKFHERHKSRYLIGFESRSDDGNSTTTKSIASTFCRWACFQAQAVNREWEQTIRLPAESADPKPRDGTKHTFMDAKSKTENVLPLPKCYGKVRQTFALHSRMEQASTDVQDLTCSVVHESKPAHPLSSTSSPSSLAKLPEFSPSAIEIKQDDGTCRKISPPTTDLAPTVGLLRNDPKALEIAAKYSATIITTSETLETLLRLPGDYSTKWMLPCTTETVTLPNSGPESKTRPPISVTILDLPIAQAFSSPRSCLEMGLQEGLYQTFIKQEQASQAVETLADNGEQDGTTHPVSRVVYSLWTLPSKNVGLKNGSRKPTRVVIRTLVRLVDAVSKLPVRLRAHVEYFSTPVDSEGGTRAEGRSRREIPNSYAKSLWILDQVLFGHKVLGLQYRIDPTTCEIVGWDTTSVAHAFAAPGSDGIQMGPKSLTNDQGPLEHWKALIHLLQSIPSIDMPETLLCLPGQMGERKKVTNDSNREEILLEEGTISTDPKDHQVQRQQVLLDPFSVSVHAACKELPTRQTQTATQSQMASPPIASTGTISLDKSVLDQAGAVILGDQALRDCRRDWEWDRSGQVPNTFPVVNNV